MDVRNEIEGPDSFDNGQENEDILENVQMQKRLWLSTLSPRDEFCNTFSRIILSIHSQTLSKDLKEFCKCHPIYCASLEGETHIVDSFLDFGYK